MNHRVEPPQPLPEEVLTRPVTGSNLDRSTFGECLGAGAAVLAFLRHLG